MELNYAADDACFANLDESERANVIQRTNDKKYRHPGPASAMKSCAGVQVRLHGSSYFHVITQDLHRYAKD